MSLFPIATALTIAVPNPALVWHVQQQPTAAQFQNGASNPIRANVSTHLGAQDWCADFRRIVAPLQRLEDGWAGVGSKAIESRVFYQVERYLSLALAGVSNPILPFVVPSANGTLQIEWHGEKLELEAMIASDGRVTAFLEDHEQGLEVEEEGDAALNLLLRWAPRAAQERSHAPDVSVAPPQATFILAA